MALLGMCLEKKIPVAAAHVNYHVRPQAEEEEAYVKAFCREHDLDCYVLDTPFQWKGNFEAAARDWRYAFFLRLVQEHGFKGILIAHQEDDFLETYLMQKERGLEPDYFGLREERMMQGVLVKRPLLTYTKAQLQAYCDAHGIRYFLDASNQDTAYARNRVRQETVAALSSFERKMLRQEIAQENAVLHERRCRVKAWAEQERVNLGQYRALGEEDRLALLRAMIEGKEHTLRRKYLAQVDAIIMNHEDFCIRLARNRQLVPQDGFFFVMPVPAPYTTVYASLAEMFQHPQGPWYRIEQGRPGVNACTVRPEDFPLTIRTRRPGDRIRQRYGTKKLDRWFIDRKVPRWQREIWPVVVNAAEKVILLPGMGCDPAHYSPEPCFSVVKFFIIGGRGK